MTPMKGEKIEKEVININCEDHKEKYIVQFGKGDTEFWGLGLENETYLRFDKQKWYTGKYIKEKIGRERYSVNYLNNYSKDIQILLNKLYKDDTYYKIDQMMNAQSFYKIDRNLEHLTTYEKEPKPNKNFSGQTIIKEWMDYDDDVKEIFSGLDKDKSNIFFDGDTIEFTTELFYKSNINKIVNELGDRKELFISKLRKFFKEKNIFKDKGVIGYPYFNPGLNQFQTRLWSFVLFNNGTYHINITLPTEIKDRYIVDQNKFIKRHQNAIKLIQWIEPFLIATLGSPDIFACGANKKSVQNGKYIMGSLRDGLSRYIGIGTYNSDKMEKGRIVQTEVDKVKPCLNERQWWYNKLKRKMNYVFDDDKIGVDFNFNKHFQSGFEFRMLDLFPHEYLPKVIEVLLLICEHSTLYDYIPKPSNDYYWNNMVYQVLKKGHKVKLRKRDYNKIIDIFETDTRYCKRYDTFFFNLINDLFEKHKNGDIIKKMVGDIKESPKWNNFNKIQYEEHLRLLKI